MNRMAMRSDYSNLPDAQQEGYAAMIRLARTHKISIRCEVVDSRDFIILAGPGFASASYWLDRFDLEH